MSGINLDSQDKDLLQNLEIPAIDQPREEDESPVIFISELAQNTGVLEEPSVNPTGHDFNPIFEVKFLNGKDEPSSIINKSDISDLILLSMEKEEEKIMDKNREMK